MPFTVSITNSESTIYSQTVESLNLMALIKAINTPPRIRKKKSDSENKKPIPPSQ